MSNNAAQDRFLDAFKLPAKFFSGPFTTYTASRAHYIAYLGMCGITSRNEIDPSRKRPDEHSHS